MNLVGLGGLSCLVGQASRLFGPEGPNQLLAPGHSDFSGRIVLVTRVWFRAVRGFKNIFRFS